MVGKELPHPSRRRSGTAILEFLTVFPLLAFVVLAGIDLGRSTITYQHVVGAQRAAQARAAESPFSLATQDLWLQVIRDAAEEHLQCLSGFEANHMTLAVTLGEGTGPDAATADITVTYPFRTIVAWPGIPQDMVLRSRGRVVRTRR